MRARKHKAIVEQGKRTQTEPYFVLQRQIPARAMPFSGEAGMHLMMFFNCCKTDLSGHV